VQDLLARTGLIGKGKVHAFVELHIEQGPELEAKVRLPHVICRTTICAHSSLHNAYANAAAADRQLDFGGAHVPTGFPLLNALAPPRHTGRTKS
jgi:hypothetical protein